MIMTWMQCEGHTCALFCGLVLLLDNVTWKKRKLTCHLGIDIKPCPVKCILSVKTDIPQWNTGHSILAQSFLSTKWIILFYKPSCFLLVSGRYGQSMEKGDLVFQDNNKLEGPDCPWASVRSCLQKACSLTSCAHTGFFSPFSAYFFNNKNFKLDQVLILI